MQINNDNIAQILVECKKYPDISFRELAKHDFPDDCFMLEGCEHGEEARYEVIASMTKEYKTNVYRGEYFGEPTNEAIVWGIICVAPVMAVISYLIYDGIKNFLKGLIIELVNSGYQSEYKYGASAGHYASIRAAEEHGRQYRRNQRKELKRRRGW